MSLGFTAFVACLAISLAICTYGRLDGVSHVWYLLAGVIAAWMFECVFKSALFPSKLKVPREDTKQPKSAVAASSAIDTVRSYLLIPFVDPDAGWDLFKGSSELSWESSLLWRFLPDILFVINGLILSGMGHLTQATVSSIFRWIGLQITSTLFVIVSLLQRGESRLNASRLFLETPFMNVIGRASFVVYLWQSAAFNFYTRVILDDVTHHTFPLPKNNDMYVREQWNYLWFAAFPIGNKIAGAVVLIFIGWAVQAYYQDYFISTLVGKLMGSFSTHQTHSRQREGTTTFNTLVSQS
jgi:hypothetical protein